VVFFKPSTARVTSWYSCSKRVSRCGPRGHRNARLLTDLSGPFFTVISDGEYESFAEWQADGQQIFGDPRFAAWFERMTALVESGRREFYNLVE